MWSRPCGRAAAGRSRSGFASGAHRAHRLFHARATALILEAVRSDRFDYINVHYYYIFQDNLPRCTRPREHDMGVFIISPTDKGGRLLHAPARSCASCPRRCRRWRSTICGAWRMDIAHAVAGGGGPVRLRRARRGAGAAGPGARAVAADRRTAGGRVRDALGEDFARALAHGLREWTELPGKVNVRRILWLDNLVRAYDLVALRAGALHRDEPRRPLGAGRARRRLRRGGDRSPRCPTRRSDP